MKITTELQYSNQLSEELIRFTFPPWRDNEADVLSVSTLSKNVSFVISSHWKFDPCQLVWYQILVASNFSFVISWQWKFDPCQLVSYKILVAPNVSFIISSQWKFDPYQLHSLIPSFSGSKCQLPYLSTVEIGPLSTCLIPNFSGSLPHQHGTAVSLETNE